MAGLSRPDFIFFGACDPAYPRNRVIRAGLRANGASVRECLASPRWKFWLRYPRLYGRYFRGRHDGAAATGVGRRFLFVPEFATKDVFPAKLLGLLTARPVVFDPLAARYETKILDWRRKPPSSLTAWWNFRLDAAAFRSADVILADTTAHKDYYVRTYGIDPRKIAVLPVGFDEADFQPVPPPATKRPGFDVLFFGSFLPLHGVDVIAEAARLLAKEADVRFRLIGDGQTFPRVRAFVEAHRLANVEFLGRLPMARLPAEIAAADLCLGVFGRTEKSRRVIPHKIFQSLAMGRAVVTARTPAVEEFFVHRRSVFFCDEPLPASLALAVLELKRDAALRESMAAEGLRLVRKEFAPPAIGRRLLDILESRRFR